MTKKPGTDESMSSFLLRASVVVLLLLYVANCFTPLRLTHDTIRYFQIETWMESRLHGTEGTLHDFLPLGYSGLLLILSITHLLHPFVITFINLVFLLGSIFFVWKIFGTMISKANLLIAVLLSWLSIKFVITPLSEMQFLFFSTGTLYFYTRYRKENRIVLLFVSFLFFLMALFTRSIAIALIIAFLLNLLIESKNRISKQIVKSKKIAAVIVVGLIAFIYFFRELRITAYANYFLNPVRRFGPAILMQNVLHHLSDWAELFVNAPSSKISFLSAGLRLTVFAIIGLIFLAATIYILLKKNNGIPPIIKCYVIIYMIIVLTWPYYESRFWLPVMPFAIGALLQIKMDRTTLRGKLIVFVKYSYILAGVFALSYYTYTSFNKKALAEKQDAGIWKSAYEIHFSGTNSKDTLRPKERGALQVLNRVDRPLFNW